MREVRSKLSADPTLLGNGVATLFNELRGLSFGAIEPSERPSRHPTLAVDALGNFLEGLRAPFESLEKSGLLGNPWAAASLRRDEVRSASVLRWFLDPNGGHGCGDFLLSHVLRRIAENLSAPFPAKPSARCAVAVEECPDGDRSSRVDIQVDDATFFLLIEVKIDAPEQPRQVERYCEVAAARAAGGRPWAVAFLTIDGRQAETAGDHIARVVPISWREMASTLRRATRTAPPIPRFLAATFAAHITSL